MAEPLRLFRDHVQGKIKMAEIEVKGVRYYAFGESAFAASTPTCLKSPTGDYYTLESIVQFWKHHHEPHAIYVRDVSGRGFQVVNVMHRQMVLDFLRDETHKEPEEFDLTAPMATAVSYSQLLFEEKREKMEPEAKRPRLLNDEPMAAPKLEEAMEVDQPASLNDSTSAYRDLAPGLPAEKIAQLRDSVQKNRKQARPTQPTETGECRPSRVPALRRGLRVAHEDAGRDGDPQLLAHPTLLPNQRLRVAPRLPDRERRSADRRPDERAERERIAESVEPAEWLQSLRSGGVRCGARDRLPDRHEPDVPRQFAERHSRERPGEQAGRRLAAGGQRRPQRTHARELRAARRVQSARPAAQAEEPPSDHHHSGLRHRAHHDVQRGGHPAGPQVRADGSEEEDEEARVRARDPAQQGQQPHRLLPSDRRPAQAEGRGLGPDRRRLRPGARLAVQGLEVQPAADRDLRQNVRLPPQVQGAAAGQERREVERYAPRALPNPTAFGPRRSAEVLGEIGLVHGQEQEPSPLLAASFFLLLPV